LETPGPPPTRKPRRTDHLIVPHDFEANYVVGFAKGMAGVGARIAVISSDETEARLAAAGIAQYKLRGSLSPQRPTWQKAVNLARYYVLLFWTILGHAGRTIHFNGLLTDRIILFDGLVLPLWMRLCAGCYVHTAHNVLPHGKEHRRLFYWAYRWIYLFPDHIIAHTPRIAEQLADDFGVSPDRISVISIGLNEEVPETPLSKVEARQKLGLPADAPLLVFFGKVESYKGVDVLAEAWGSVQTPGARAVVVGWCPDAGYTRKIREAMARSSRAASIEWREGFVPNEDVALWLKACDAVVMPYRNIYQSGVVFLCLRFGVPIIATRVGSLPEFIVDGQTGVFADENTPAGIARAIDRFFATAGNFSRPEIARRAAPYGWPHQCRVIKHLYP
jgi:glycosyltransferase involved in cell wall biosynthesis